MFLCFFSLSLSLGLCWYCRFFNNVVEHQQVHSPPPSEILPSKISKRSFFLDLSWMCGIDGKHQSFILRCHTGQSIFRSNCFLFLVFISFCVYRKLIGYQFNFVQIYIREFDVKRLRSVKIK